MAHTNPIARPSLTTKQGKRTEIPNKLFFRIGEVCKLIKLEPYVLRFWETEFPMLTPTKGANGRRMYRKKDVELLFRIKELLYDQGFTIAGARKVLGDMRKGSAIVVDSPAVEKNTIPGESSHETAPAKVPVEELHQLKSELRDILTILNRRC